MSSIIGLRSLLIRVKRDVKSRCLVSWGALGGVDRKYLWMAMINVHFINVWTVIRIKNKLNEYMANIFRNYVRELCNYKELQTISIKLLLNQSTITCLWSHDKILVGVTMRLGSPDFVLFLQQSQFLAAKLWLCTRHSFIGTQLRKWLAVSLSNESSNRISLVSQL